MRAYGDEIIAVTEASAPRLLKLDPDEVRKKPSPEKWSKIEILGHLTDSAQVNLQRMIRGQVEVSPKITYAQDEWVRLQQYQGYDLAQLVGLWRELNRHLGRTVQVMDDNNLQRTCDTGKNGPDLHTLEFLAGDYLVHMNHHLDQIFGSGK